VHVISDTVVLTAAALRGWNVRLTPRNENMGSANYAADSGPIACQGERGWCIVLPPPLAASRTMTIDHFRRQLLLSAAASPFALGSGLAHAQTNWPTKPVRVIYPFPPGGAGDILARTLAPELQRAFNQPFTVDNIAGDGGNTGAAVAAKAAPDGYTLFVCTVGTHAINQTLYPKLAFDPIKDFAPITLIADVPNVMVMNPESAKRIGVKNLADFVRIAPTLKEPLKMASSGNGSSAHMGGEMFKMMTGANMVHIPYKGAAPAMVDLLAGKVDVEFDNMPSSLPHIKSGKLLALGVTSSTRSMQLLEMPTIAEAGGPSLKDYDATSWFGLLAVAGTPLDVISRIQMESSRALYSDDVRKKLHQQGAIPSGMSSAAFARMIASETHKWAKVIRLSGARAT
jgi:tripartite-type tricarboxylate transporter receptor subunit TctC